MIYIILAGAFVVMLAAINDFERAVCSAEAVSESYLSNGREI